MARIEAVSIVLPRISGFSYYVQWLNAFECTELNLFVGLTNPQTEADPYVRMHSMSSGQCPWEIIMHSSVFSWTLPIMGGILSTISVTERGSRHWWSWAKRKLSLSLSMCLRSQSHTTSYKTLSLPFIHKELVFDNLVQARDFLMDHQCAFFTNPNSPDEQKTLDCNLLCRCLRRCLKRIPQDHYQGCCIASPRTIGPSRHAHSISCLPSGFQSRASTFVHSIWFLLCSGNTLTCTANTGYPRMPLISHQHLSSCSYQLSSLLPASRFTLQCFYPSMTMVLEFDCAKGRVEGSVNSQLYIHLIVCNF